MGFIIRVSFADLRQMEGTMFLPDEDRLQSMTEEELKTELELTGEEEYQAELDRRAGKMDFCINEEGKVVRFPFPEGHNVD